VIGTSKWYVESNPVPLRLALPIDKDGDKFTSDSRSAALLREAGMTARRVAEQSTDIVSPAIWPGDEIADERAGFKVDCSDGLADAGHAPYQEGAPAGRWSAFPHLMGLGRHPRPGRDSFLMRAATRRPLAGLDAELERCATRSQGDRSANRDPPSRAAARPPYPTIFSSANTFSAGLPQDVERPAPGRRSRVDIEVK